MSLILENVSRVVEGEHWISDISLSFEPGSFIVLLGRTLSGKTTLMRLMAGLDRPSQGRVLMNGVDVTGVAVRDRNLFRKLCDLGGQLVALHLLKSPLLAASPATFPIGGSSEVETVRYDEGKERVYINKEQYFAGIGKDLYEFQVGGYQVMNKWLKDRKGRTLSYDDISHYLKVASALTHTMRLMAEIDEAIPNWPIT